MWPKALTQLIELAPHITRLAPLADRFLKDKANGDETTRQTLDSHRTALEAQRAAVTDLSDRLHADMGSLSSAQASQGTQFATLGRQIADLDKHLVSTRGDALAAKQATESLETRLARIEASQGRSSTLAIIALGLLTAILLLMITLFVRAR